MRWIFIIFFFLVISVAHGQQKKCRYVHRFNGEIVLDSLTVLPSSIEIAGGDSVGVIYNPNTGNVFLETKNAPDSVEICYQTLPFALHKTYMRRDVAEIGTDEAYEHADEALSGVEVGIQREELFYTDNLYKSGSLSRSISFGNAQDVVVNSQLNLQLEGKLTDDINIRASITDEDVPYQPEGNTAQVQDFDNVFIELYNDKFDLTAGDLVLKDHDSYFLKYNRNVQGGQLNLKYKVGEKGEATTSIGASVAKGKFASVVLDVQEGVAGPYRIEIPDASKLAIILANSEKVFLDGRQLQRGYDYDYIIDYDKAEITFTSRILVTQYSRVRIDVEYADQNYGRSIFAFNHYQTQGRADFFINYYSEKDNRNNPLKYDLSDSDKLLLASAGDDLESAYQEGFEKADYNPQKVQYKLLDTVTIDMKPVQVFQYATNAEGQLYDVVFTEVNYGEGDYVKVNDLVNGIVFRWVSPENGIQMGNYIPARKVVPPVKKNMTDGGASYKFTDHEKAYAEVALSNYDKNLYSTIDKGDDKDFAYLVGVESKGRTIGKDIKVNSGVSFEKNGKYFTPIDRFRYVEFDRDWNYNQAKYQDISEENILRANLGFVKDADDQLTYELISRKRGEAINGTQQVINFNKKVGRIYSHSDAFFMQNQSIDFSSRWNRLNTDVNYQSKIFVPGYQFSIDRNIIQDIDSDSVISTEMNYYQHMVYLKSNDTLKTRFRLDYAYREDQLPMGGVMELSNISHTSSFSVQHDAKNQQLDALITYRKSENKLSDEGKNEETINARVDWYANLLNDHVKSDLSYAVGSGRELKKDFIFVEVPTGQGTHTWRDDNNNGVQELNEFYLAVNPEEKNYAKIFVPTDEYVFAHTNDFSYRLNAEMPRSWISAGGLRSFLSRFSTISSLTSQRKITDQALSARFLPFGNNIDEEDLISGRYALNARVFFNRRDARYGLDAGYSKYDNKQYLTGGFEKRRSEMWNANFRSNIRQAFSINLKLVKGKISNSSDFLEGKNYEIDDQEMNPLFSWQPNVHFRVSCEYAYKNKVAVGGEEFSHIHEGAFSTIYNKASQMSINSSFKVSNIDFEGLENSPVGYELLEALRPGRNYIWNIVFQKKLIAGLQLSVNYEGRKSADYKVVHIGRMQVSVLF